MQPELVRHALILSLLLFVVGAVGVFLRRNIITVFMCVELMLNAVNLSFVAFSRALGTLDAQVLVFFVLAGFLAPVCVSPAKPVMVCPSKVKLTFLLRSMRRPPWPRR